MKHVCTSLTILTAAILTVTFFALSAHAEDRKIGNLIAVERDVTNLYDRCLANVLDDTSKEQAFFTCSINFLKSSFETSLSKGSLLRLEDSQCSVNIDTINGVLFVSFGKSKKASSLDVSKDCLQKALENHNSLKVLVYTIE